MNNIGIYICNFNGKDWVIGCIESLKKQLLQSFDIYVVDNASTDGTVDTINANYADCINVLQNEENIGGAGGFDRGIRHGISNGYKYIVLLDNDITLDPTALQNMYTYMETHNDTGIVGSKVMIMDMPEYIQDFGCKLDFEKFKEYPQYQFFTENEVPESWECDYVPTCAVMIRTSVVEECGSMPVDNFIYYDDIELSYRMKLRGYKVVALGNAKVYHKGGFRKVETNTFPKYYFMRNRLHFFSKYVSDDKIEQFTELLIKEIYAQLFGFYIKGKKEQFFAINAAFHDYLGIVRGKAADNRIIPLSDNDMPFESIFSKQGTKIKIRIINNFVDKDPYDIFRILIWWFRVIQKKYKQKSIAIGLEDSDYSAEEFISQWKEVLVKDNPDYDIPELYVTNDADDDFDKVIRLCPHIKEVNENILPQIWVDRYGNAITTDETYHYTKAYKLNESFFMEVYKPLMIDAIKKIKG